MVELAFQATNAPAKYKRTMAAVESRMMKV
jgi:hypothetical protein